MTHSYGYKFTTSVRSQTHKSGLDFTKIVIITNPDYISANDSMIDQDEYNETRNNINKIVMGASNFINDYINHVTGVALLSNQEFKRRYQYSPLKYFHTELGISS